VHSVENLKWHFRKLGFTPDDKVYYLKHFRSKIIVIHIANAVVRQQNREEMHIVALLLKNNTAIAATKRE